MNSYERCWCEHGEASLLTGRPRRDLDVLMCPVKLQELEGGGTATLPKSM